MLKKLQVLRSSNECIYSVLISAVCMAVSMGAASLYGFVAGQDPANATLLLTFGLIVLSCSATKYLYGILCSLLAVFWLWLTQDISPCRLPVTFIGMAAVTLFVHALMTRSAAQAGLIAEREKQLAEADMEKTRANLLRAISHDLRTPLSGILGNCLIFLENQPLLSEEEKRLLVVNVQQSSRWLINMVENLLSITRIREERPTITTNDELVEEVISEALQKMEKRHPDCTVHVKIPDQILLIPMDVVLIEQVILNLLENAVLHSGSSEPVDIIVEDGSRYVTFTVRDYGNGIPENRLSCLFDGTDYSAVHAPDAHKGMGIGLVICKTIITAHQGTITGRNHEHGAEFVFTLPKSRDQENPS